LGQGALCSLIFSEKIAGLAKKADLSSAVLSDEGKDARTNKKSKSKDNAADAAAAAMEEEMGLTAQVDADFEKVRSQKPHVKNCLFDSKSGIQQLY
jgi:hypothetical protein